MRRPSTASLELPIRVKQHFVNITTRKAKSLMRRACSPCRFFIRNTKNVFCTTVVNISNRRTALFESMGVVSNWIQRSKDSRKRLLHVNSATFIDWIPILQIVFFDLLCMTMFLKTKGLGRITQMGTERNTYVKLVLALRFLRKQSTLILNEEIIQINKIS